MNPSTDKPGPVLPKKEHRIYDTLAQIFSGCSECVAVAQIGQITYIAANEVTGNFAKKDQKLIRDSVTLISNFLRDPSKNIESEVRAFGATRDSGRQTTVPFGAGISATDPIKKMVFCELIYPLERPKSALKIAGSSYTSEIHVQATKHAMSGSKDLNLPELQSAVGHNEGMAGYGYYSAMAQWEHLGKAMDYFKAPETFPPLSWVYDRKADEKVEEKVHAEMKILNQLLEDFNAGKISSGTEIYIGISKECCFNCHHTLEAARKPLKDAGINIEILNRGSHDLKFSDWALPSILRTDNLSSYNEATKKIIASIKTEGVTIHQKKDVSMGASQASSSDEELDLATTHNLYLDSLRKILIKEGSVLLPEDLYFEEHSMISIGLALHEDEARAFSGLFNFDDPLDKKEAEGYFYDFLQHSKHSPKELFKFLKNPRFCSKKIANCFTNLGANVLEQGLKTPAPTSFTSPPPPPVQTPIEAPMQIDPVTSNPPLIDMSKADRSTLTAFNRGKHRMSPPGETTDPESAKQPPSKLVKQSTPPSSPSH